MSNTPGQLVVPMLAYEDGNRAMDWLIAAFGFRERMRMRAESGGLMHGELDTPLGGRIMVADGPAGYESARTLAARDETTRRRQATPWATNGLLVFAGDVTEHIRVARAAGALILSEIEDGPPGRRYRAEDLEGHRWMFIEP